MTMYIKRMVITTVVIHVGENMEVENNEATKDVV